MSLDTPAHRNIIRRLRKKYRKPTSRLVLCHVSAELRALDELVDRGRLVEITRPTGMRVYWFADQEAV